MLLAMSLALIPGVSVEGAGKILQFYKRREAEL